MADEQIVLGSYVENTNSDDIVFDGTCCDFSKVKETLYINPLFPNNFLMNIYDGILRYISAHVPRQIKYHMVTTYQKGIERLHKKYNQDVDVYVKPFPSLILQPNMIKIDERINTTWQTMSPMSEWVVRGAYPPYASIGNLKIWVVPNRFTTTFELFYIGESYPEIMDMYFHMNRLFNTRYKYIEGISESQIMISDSVVKEVEDLYEANLFELSDDFVLSFNSAYNRTFYTTPWKNNIHIKLLDASDGSNYMGDTELPTYRINFSFEAFFQLPNHLVLGFDTDYTGVTVDLSTSASQDSDSIDIGTYLLVKDGEAYIVHIYDDYPEDIVLSISRSKINPEIFEYYYVKITNIESGISDIITQDQTDKFQVEINDTDVTFKLFGMEPGYVIDIIGKYITV